MEHNIDETEGPRRARMAEIAAEPDARAELEARYGRVWSTEELQKEFEVVGFMAPFCVVIRRADGCRGSVEFKAHPRWYFNFVPYQENP